ncbi:MAG: hypothetical protein ACLTT1_01785 [[Clostridium] scindens]
MRGFRGMTSNPIRESKSRPDVASVTQSGSALECISLSNTDLVRWFPEWKIHAADGDSVYMNVTEEIWKQYF